MKIEVKDEGSCGTPDGVPQLSAQQWEEIQWLLRTIEGWLLVAEPSTVRELDEFLRGEGSGARAGDVVSRLGSLDNM